MTHLGDRGDHAVPRLVFNAAFLSFLIGISPSDWLRLGFLYLMVFLL